MLIDKDIAEKHWRVAAEEQLKRTYEALGYRVKVRARVGQFEADLTAKKGKELIVFEIKSKSDTSIDSKKFSAFRNYVVKELHGKFKIVYVAAPREVSLDIEGLPHALLEALMENPRGLDELATHVRVDEVDGLEIDFISISRGGVRVVGAATAYIELQYGSGSDIRRGDGVSAEDSYPFTFDIVLNESINISKINSLEVDTSSFYE